MANEKNMQLVVRVSGKVTESNFGEYKENILALAGQVNLDPKTDEEFAEAEETIKAFSEAEKAIDDARERAMNETVEIREMFAAMSEVADKLRDIRLDLAKKVKEEKERKKSEALSKGIELVEAHINYLYEKYPFIKIGTFHVCQGDFLPAVKGKKKIETYQAAVDDTAEALIKKFDEVAEHCKKNSETILAVDDQSLFPDFGDLIKQPFDVVSATIKARVAEKKLEEEQRKKQEEKKVVIPESTTPEPLPGTSLSNEEMLSDKLNHAPIHGYEKNECSVVDAGHVELPEYVMVVGFSGYIENIKKIAKEVDSAVSKHKEVISIVLRKA